MPQKILIIKLGAMGDVLRTTALLNVLNGDIFWVTKERSTPLLPSLKKVIDLNFAQEVLKNEVFDLVLCLDDDLEAARLASRVNKTELIGSFLDSFGRLSYTDSSAEWFNMGLISIFGKGKADISKKNNKKTYQEIIFNMLGLEFKGEEYVLNPEIKPAQINKDKALIGIESRADDRWPTKKWNEYQQLADLLQGEGFEVKFFRPQPTLQQYINDISECDLVVTGDTLALHVALALKINTVAIFTCTSPHEIYDYSRMIKIISPLLDSAFYKQEYIKEAVDAVSLDSVYQAVKGLSITNIPV